MTMQSRYCLSLIPHTFIKLCDISPARLGCPSNTMRKRSWPVINSSHLALTLAHCGTYLSKMRVPQRALCFWISNNDTNAGEDLLKDKMSHIWSRARLCLYCFTQQQNFPASFLKIFKKHSRLPKRKEVGATSLRKMTPYSSFVNSLLWISSSLRRMTHQSWCFHLCPKSWPPAVLMIWKAYGKHVFCIYKEPDTISYNEFPQELLPISIDQRGVLWSSDAHSFQNVGRWWGELWRSAPNPKFSVNS